MFICSQSVNERRLSAVVAKFASVYFHRLSSTSAVYAKMILSVCLSFLQSIRLSHSCVAEASYHITRLLRHLASRRQIIHARSLMASPSAGRGTAIFRQYLTVSGKWYKVKTWLLQLFHQLHQR